MGSLDHPPATPNDETPMTPGEIQSQIREFLRNKFPAARTAELGPTDKLLDRGLIDSMGVLEIVLFVEQAFQVTMEDEEMIPENFESLEALSSLVHGKLRPVAS